MNDNHFQFKTFKDFIGELQVTYKRTKLETTKISKSEDAVKFIKPYFQECIDDHEEVKILYLNNNNMVLNVEHHTCGTETASIVSIKIMFRKILLTKTTAIIFFHNHPSGKLKPSAADIKITQKIKRAAEILDIDFMDSIILTSEGYYSMADHGIF